ncbi:uncharacterized protein E5676_scaffold832G00250 [Cucumis melo var. makuwa]|uniref:Uncharacterized protein n=1 Tax=Cucumis melo var. makuwa TaxID=1194695 RepID=A0A5A7T170_CUCMM|nr:uncharacterized protein E6C27_scaffold379G001440 [Cucumis melo var. makuwa]TYK13846.1 uncharacterized protein E5676_scaffold832G00250 [Cucumis melo var. makuwa]
MVEGVLRWRGRRYYEDSLVTASEFWFTLGGLGGGLHTKGEVVVGDIVGLVGFGDFKLSCGGPILEQIGKRVLYDATSWRQARHFEFLGGIFGLRVLGKGVRRKLWRVLWCAMIYFIWKECNHRLQGA